MASVVEDKNDDKFMIKIIQIFICVLLFPTIIQAKSNVITPLQFGLREAVTDVDRFKVLYKTHVEAIKKGFNIKYEGIDTIRIEIPKDAKTIPLPKETDFGNVVIVVRNNSMNTTLFSMINPIEKYTIGIEMLEGKTEIADKGNFIISIEDSVPWVKNRVGYGYGFNRKDILYVNNGVIEGSILSSYQTEESKPIISRSYVELTPKIIKNLSVIRDSRSTYKTFVIKIENQYNVIISNLSIKTPPNKWFGDTAIRLDNCYKVIIHQTTIDGTYSQRDKYGYGITMINVSDVEINDLYAHANWGVFGNNNVSNIRLKKCDINRFDVHCYGKDVYFNRCVFRNLYNQFSSMYGTVSFQNCVFINFVPVLIEPSYNAYTKFDLRFKNCTIYANKERRYLISGGNFNNRNMESRKELQKQEFPNLYIDGLKIKMQERLDHYYIYKFNRHLIQWPNDSIPGLIKIKRLKFVPNIRNVLRTTNLQSFVRYPDSDYLQTLTIGGIVFLFASGGCWYYHYKEGKNSLRV